jgi:hypothetical protein
VGIEQDCDQQPIASLLDAQDGAYQFVRNP